MKGDVINFILGGAEKKAAKKSPAKKTTEKKPAKKSAQKKEIKAPKTKLDSSKRYTGVVVRYGPRGFGFIKSDDIDVEVFVHHKDLAASGIKQLSEGMMVSFSVNDKPTDMCKGTCANDVKIEKSMKGGNQVSGMESEVELFHRLLSLPYEKVKDFYDHAGITPENMVGGGKMSKLAMINNLLAD
jgi:cold shock CspA family protein